jgi:hypothetical protein
MPYEMMICILVRSGHLLPIGALESVLQVADQENLIGARDFAPESVKTLRTASREADRAGEKIL